MWVVAILEMMSCMCDAVRCCFEQTKRVNQVNCTPHHYDVHPLIVPPIHNAHHSVHVRYVTVYIVVLQFVFWTRAWRRLLQAADNEQRSGGLWAAHMSLWLLALL